MFDLGCRGGYGEFFAEVFSSLPEGAFAAACSKQGDPGKGGWPAHRADHVIEKLSATSNNFIGCSSYFPGEDGSFRARKGQFAACHFLMLDEMENQSTLTKLACHTDAA